MRAEAAEIDNKPPTRQRSGETVFSPPTVVMSGSPAAAGRRIQVGPAEVRPFPLDLPVSDVQYNANW